MTPQAGGGTARVPAHCLLLSWGAPVVHILLPAQLVTRAGKREVQSPSGPTPTSALSTALAEWPGLHQEPGLKVSDCTPTLGQEKDWQQAWELG